MYYNSKSIILKNKNYKESDKIVTIFTEKQGKITAIAKGVQKAKSSLRGCVQPFCHSFLNFYHGQDLDLVTQGKIIDFFGNSREDINRTLYSMYIMELLDKSLMEKVVLPELYQLTVKILDLLNREGLKLLLIRYFEMQLLLNLGYKPVTNYCVLCGGTITSGVKFSLSEGGVVCDKCLQDGEPTIGMTGETHALVKLLIEGRINTIQKVKVSPSAMKQLEYFTEKYLEYYLERRFNVKNTIRFLKKDANLLD